MQASLPRLVRAIKYSTLRHGRQPLIHFRGQRQPGTSPATASLTRNGTLSVPQRTSFPSLCSALNTKTQCSMSSKERQVQETEYQDIGLPQIRKVIAKRLTESKMNYPHMYTTINIELDPIMALRRDLKVNFKQNISLNDFLIKAIACAMRDVPEANCTYDIHAQQIRANTSIDVSIAVATKTGLITPIIPQIQAKGLAAIHEKFKEIINKAREGKLQPHEYQGGTVTVSNLGGYGISRFSAIINPPHSCIIAVGGGIKRLVSLEKETEPRIATVMTATMSADRRIFDDVIAGQFLQTFKTYMENPCTLSI